MKWVLGLISWVIGGQMLLLMAVWLAPAQFDAIHWMYRHAPGVVLVDLVGGFLAAWLLWGWVRKHITADSVGGKSGRAARMGGRR